MEQLTVVLIGLFAVLFIGHVLMKETFADMSDRSINLSLTDLMAVLTATAGNTSAPAPASASASASTDSDTVSKDVRCNASQQGLTYNDAVSYMDMRDMIKNDIRESVGNQLHNSPAASYAAAAAAAGSPSTYQGINYIESIPGRSPADDYIRKDSIPCYACSLPE